MILTAGEELPEKYLSSRNAGSVPEIPPRLWSVDIEVNGTSCMPCIPRPNPAAICVNKHPF